MNTTQSNEAEHLTLGVLMSGVAALALSDFVSPIYWSLPVIAALLRIAYGRRFALSEMHASFIGWFGFLWVGLELILGRAWVVAFTDFLLILALAVTIESATPRNHLHRMLTGLFLMLAGAVLTDSVLYAIPLLALMWFIWRASSCLYGLEQVGGDLPTPRIRHDFRSNSLMVVMTLSLFLLLPRFDIQSKLQPTQPRMATTGFSDHVKLGDFAHDLDSTVVMRIESLDTDTIYFKRQIMNRYWRGVVLSDYHHHVWKQRASKQTRTWSPEQDVSLQKNKPNAINVALFREASDHPYMMLANGLTHIQALHSTSFQDDLRQFHFTKPPNRRLRFVMQIAPLGSASHVPSPSEIAPQGDEKNQDVPQAIQDWVKDTIAPNIPAPQALQQLNQTLHAWTYDLHVILDEQHPLASFIQLKRGHCELYASTLALAARNLGIPARIVNGYFGGEWNDTGNFLIIRQQHAHSWVEVWLNGHWQRMDPTPASRWQLTNIQFPAWDHVWETVKLTWYRYILEFQNQDREALFKSLMNGLKLVLPWLLSCLIAVFVLYQMYQKVKKYRHTIHLHRHQHVIDMWLLQHAIKRESFEPLRRIKTPQHIKPEHWLAWLKQWEKDVYQQKPLPPIQQLKKQLKRLE
ncbi:MAG: DUF3488 and transglutaminase-like domain-containing protein [Mariprofundaceae bacterium]|nr:DUF3488 and transglutaminase-like domain-containing protein [Mariprofundaceae bacterium]